jgi:hypothetical protein
MLEPSSGCKQVHTGIVRRIMRRCFVMCQGMLSPRACRDAVEQLRRRGPPSVC